MSQRISITDHAAERLKERLGLPKSARRSTAQRAFHEGARHADARGPLKRYLDDLFLRHMKGNNMRLYGQNIFVFHDLTLITVLHLPHHLEGAARKSARKA